MSFTTLLTRGIRVEPPTRRTLSSSLALRPESLRQSVHGFLVLAC